MCPGSPYLRCADMDADQLTEIQAQDLPEGLKLIDRVRNTMLRSITVLSNY